jgi:hypothetical protein
MHYAIFLRQRSRIVVLIAALFVWSVNAVRQVALPGAAGFGAAATEASGATTK